MTCESLLRIVATPLSSDCLIAAGSPRCLKKYTSSLSLRQKGARCKLPTRNGGGGERDSRHGKCERVCLEGSRRLDHDPGQPGLGRAVGRGGAEGRSEGHTSELQSLRHLVCRLLLEK